MKLLKTVNFFLDLLRRARREISPRPPSDMKKVALIVGHSFSSQGALAFNGESEYQFNARIAEKVKNELLRTCSDVRCEVFFRNGKTLAQLGEQIGNWGAALSIELHFNSFKKAASGCEVLVLGKDALNEAKFFADKLTDSISSMFGIRQRGDDGVRFINKNCRGYRNLSVMRNNGVKTAVLLEPAFMNFKTKESEAIINGENDYIRCISGEIITFFRGK